MAKNQVPSKGDLFHPWWRSMRVLFEDGRPLQPHKRLVADPTIKGPRPFGVLAKTQAGEGRHRLIFWPPLPKGLPEPTPEHPHRITDHITLELWNGKSHPTWYRHDGRSESPDESRGWKLKEVEGRGISYWFSIFVQFAVLEEQDYELEVNVRMPTSDSQRRMDEYARHSNTSVPGCVELPPLPHVGNYACFNFFVVTERGKPKDLKALVDFLQELPLLAQVKLDDTCSKPTMTAGTLITINGTEVVILAACPGGTISEALELGVAATAGR